jgi:hypothetical protein
LRIFIHRHPRQCFQLGFEIRFLLAKIEDFFCSSMSAVVVDPIFDGLDLGSFGGFFRCLAAVTAGARAFAMDLDFPLEPVPENERIQLLAARAANDETFAVRVVDLRREPPETFALAEQLHALIMPHCSVGASEIRMQKGTEFESSNPGSFGAADARCEKAVSMLSCSAAFDWNGHRILRTGRGGGHSVQTSTSLP